MRYSNILGTNICLKTIVFYNFVGEILKKTNCKQIPKKKGVQNRVICL